MNKFNELKKTLIVILFFIICLTGVFAIVKFNVKEQEVYGNALNGAAGNTATVESNKPVTYISDITGKCQPNGYLPYGVVADKTDKGAKLTVKIDGAATYFDKGLYTPTPKSVIYNISDLDYKYFFSYIAVQNGTSANGRALFSVDLSNSATGGWVNKYVSSEITSNDSAKQIRIEIGDYSYIRIRADFAEGTRTSAAAVWADAKFTDSETNEVEYLVKSVEEYDEIIKSKYLNADLSDTDFELTLLQRNFVSKFGSNGHVTLHNYIKSDSKVVEAFSWLFDNVDVLRMFTTGGTPDNANMYLKNNTYNQSSWFNSLKVLTNLYNTYKDDLNDNTLTALGNRRGDVYQKMMISISLTYSKRVRFWIYDIGPNNTLNETDNDSNAIDRYAAFKKVWLAGKLDNAIFENIEVEEMRYIMTTLLPDNEIEWLLDYWKWKGTKGPYSLMKYEFAYEFWSGAPHLYDPAKKDYYYQKYRLDGYGIEYKKYYTHAWMMFETGGVCWNMSNIGANMTAVWGHPSTPLGQSGYVEHVAYADYYINSNGDGYWALTNDVFGWVNTNFKNFNNLGSAGGWYTLRTMNDWGTGSYASYACGTYLLLAQAAINDFENYEKAKELTLLAEVYRDDLPRQEEIYRQALAVQKINLDAWIGIINNYVAQGKSGDDFIELAREVADSLKYYPLPMHDMLRLIEKYAKDDAYKAVLTMIRSAALKEASTAKESQVLQSNVTRTMANHLLGIINTEVAKFDFDGDGGGTLALGKMYETSNPTWEYSLDGGTVWTAVEGEKVISLSQSQMDLINTDTDILVHVIGTPRVEKNIYVIDITKANTPNGFYVNDWENKVFGLDETMDWRFKGNTAWTAFKREQPNLTGDKIIEIRRRASGTSLASEYATYSLTSTGENNPNKRYIPVSNMSVYRVSSEAVSNQGAAANIIDGNYNTRWHSDWSGNDRERYIIIEFNNQFVLTGIDYIPAGGGNGKILQGKIYGSATGDYWTELASVTWANNETLKTAEFSDNTLKIKYVKIVGEKCSGGKSFISGRMFNFYHNEDASRNLNPVAGLEFDTTVLTNGNVTVTLVNPSTSIVVTNNNSRTSYTFTQNGSFRFEFKDKNGLTGYVTAEVDWIDKILPTATAKYSTTDKTKENVTVELTFSEDVVINNNGGRNTYTFSANGQFTFYFTDFAGNQNTFTAQVSNIFKDKPKVTQIVYSEINPTNSDVVVTLYFDRPVKCYGETVYSETYSRTFTQNGYTIIAFRDELDNAGSTPITISNIDKDTPIGTITYSTLDKADKIIAFIDFDEENVSILNNGGLSSYTFTENGTFTFEFTDRAGNRGKATANVTWVDKSVPAPEIRYSATSATNQNVTASLIVGGNVIQTHTFTENGKYTFSYTLNGKNLTATASVDWIDKKAPEATVVYSTRNWTRTDVTATVTFDENDVIILNNGSSNTYVFSKNGKFTFKFRDKAGNEGEAEAAVNCIYKKAPSPVFEYSTTNLTNSNVTVRITDFTSDEYVDEASFAVYKKSITVTSNFGNRYFVFTQNDTFMFSYYDGAGNKGTQSITVDWIDKVAPVGSIEYSNYDITRDAVSAYITFSKPNVTITNNSGKNRVVFEDNGSFTFTFADALGNNGTATATVNWINKNLPVVTVNFNYTEKTDKDVVATVSFDNPDVIIVNNEGKADYTFTENGSFTFEYVYGENDFASYTVEVTWIKKTITITFTDGVLLKEDVIAYGSAYQILFKPESTETRIFSHWVCGDKEYYEGDILNPEDDINLVAVYVDIGGNDNDNDNDNDGDTDNSGDTDNGTTEGDGAQSESNAGLIAGLVIGAVLVLTGVGLTVFFVIKRKSE